MEINMNYKESMAYIHGAQRFGSRPGLERITELCERLGNPQKGLRFIHVTGTNGKGSVCAMIYAALRFAGIKTGLFTSPYMLDFSERFVSDGKRITHDEIAEITTVVAEAAADMEDTPTEFEILTAMSFLFFRKRESDIIVFEVGMGGRLDSTNIIDTPLAAVITGIALDHCAVLGDTEEKIAAEKAGIIKGGCPVITGEMSEEALAVIEKAAAGKGSKVTRTGNGTRYDVTSCTYTKDGTSFVCGGRGPFKLPLAGTYQTQNAAVAIAALDTVRICGKALPDIVISKGIARAKWHGRFEVFSPDPVLLFDGAHNPQGAEKLAESVAAYWGDKRFCLVTGVLADKDHAEMCKIVARFADEAYTITPHNARAMDAADYAAELRSVGIKATPCADMAEALERTAGRDTIVMGSLYTYREFIDALNV